MINFNKNWLYISSDIPNGHTLELDEKDFINVCLPHANKILETHKALDFQQHIESFRFVSWYRKRFSIEPSQIGKRFAVEFLAVATTATVFVNGQYAGEHRGAYTSFIIDITKFIHIDGSDNVIAVKVDSTKQCDLPPEGHNVDFLLFGGIVRSVNLIITDPLHIEWVFMTTPELTADSGRLNVSVKVINDRKKPVTCKVETILKDSSDKQIFSMVTPASSLETG